MMTVYLLNLSGQYGTMESTGADPEGGFLGLQPPPPKWSEVQYKKCSATNVLSHGDALIYIAIGDCSSGQV